MPAATVSHPRLTRCKCGEEVLEVAVREILPRGGGGMVTVLVERTAIMPEHPCPDCLARRARGYSESASDRCERCKGTRRIGEPYPSDAVRVDEEGRARWLRGRPAEGDGVYALHACPLALAG